MLPIRESGASQSESRRGAEAYRGICRRPCFGVVTPSTTYSRRFSTPRRQARPSPLVDLGEPGQPHQDQADRADWAKPLVLVSVVRVALASVYLLA